MFCSPGSLLLSDSLILICRSFQQITLNQVKPAHITPLPPNVPLLYLRPSAPPFPLLLSFVASSSKLSSLCSYVTKLFHPCPDGGELAGGSMRIARGNMCPLSTMKSDALTTWCAAWKLPQIGFLLKCCCLRPRATWVTWQRNRKGTFVFANICQENLCKSYRVEFAWSPVFSLPFFRHLGPWIPKSYLWNLT